MYAWRAMIGLVKPTHRGKSFHFWYGRAPDGVEIVPTFVGFWLSGRQTFENPSSVSSRSSSGVFAIRAAITSLRNSLALS